MEDHVENVEAEDFYIQVYPRLLKFCAAKMRMAYDNPDLQDVVSETFIRCYKNWDRYDDCRASRWTWLSSIARNVIKDYYSRKKRRREVPFMEDVIAVEQPNTYVKPFEDVILEVWKKTGAPDKHFLVWFLSVLGFTGEEVANLMDIGLDAVKYRRVAFKRRMYDAMCKDYVDD